MKNITSENQSKLRIGFNKIVLIAIGLGALIWFLIRVIPKPSRATYPCQRAAFPLATAFVIWLTGLVSSYFGIKYIGNIFRKYRWVGVVSSVLIIVVLSFWVTIIPSGIYDSYAAKIDTTYRPAVGFDWKPGVSNEPIGVAQGIFPGRVVMSRNPEATKWAGNWKLNEDQWWLDKNTDVEKVSEMLSVTIQKLTGAKNDKVAWNNLFEYYNKNQRQLNHKGYQSNEIVALKINLNNSNAKAVGNSLNASPQMVLAMVRQLVNNAKVPQNKIIVYDARRNIFPEMLTEIWREFKDVRFLQQDPPAESQAVNPAYGSSQGLEGADWVEGVSYSAGDYNEAKLIPRQIKEATYIINMALLKLHSYPYNYMEGGDEGQTGITMSGKNHFGSIKGTAELHGIINTKKKGVKNAYSPIVDLAASPNLGAKTILFVIDGLYAGRKHMTFPLHFPNPPFNNKTVPYENTDWPACVLASLDEVAIESVGLDIMYAQSKNNTEPSYHNVPRILVRDNADDFMNEMAMPENAPSGTKYIQDGKPVKSLGVHEHWDNDNTMRYSRNLDPKNGKGIELVYIPLGSAAKGN